MNRGIDVYDDADVQGLFSALVTGLVPREFVKHLFLSRCIDGSNLLEIDGCDIHSKKVSDLKSLAKRMDFKGLSQMKKGELVDLLMRFEESLTYFPAEAIGGIRRYQNHLKNKKRVEKAVGKAVADSLSWLHDTERPFYMEPSTESMYDSFETRLLKGLYRGNLTRTVYKTKCMEDFCLSGSQMEELKCQLAENPHPYAKYPMKLYIEGEVLLHAIKKHGSWKKFILARQKKAERRCVREEKQNNASPGENTIIMPSHTSRADLPWLDMSFQYAVERPGRLSDMFSVSRTPQRVSKKRSRDKPHAAQPHRGLNSQSVSLTNLESWKNECGVDIYRCGCGYSAGKKKMQGHMAGHACALCG